MLSVQRRIGASWKTSVKLRHRNGWGQRCTDSACSFVISAVSTMKPNGATKMIAAAISRE